MRELLRTLTYELLAPSPLPLLQRSIGLSISIGGLLSAYAFGRRNRQRCPAPITPE